MRCKECYSEHPRKTPLLKPRECLQKHKQYVCGTCGRCICIDQNDKGLQRWMFPFRTLEIAMLYLRSADITMNHPCGIYCITNSSGRSSYKIFADGQTLINYQKKHPESKVSECLYRNDTVYVNSAAQVRTLTQEEVEHYLSEQ